MSKIALTNAGTFAEVEFFLSSPWEDAYGENYGKLTNLEVSYVRK